MATALGMLLLAIGPRANEAQAKTGDDRLGATLVLSAEACTEPIDDVVRVIDQRLRAVAAGTARRVDDDADDRDRIICSLVPGLPRHEVRAVVRRVVSRGDLAFRILADEGTTRRETALRKALGEYYEAPTSRYEWASTRNDREQCLLEAPERPYVLALGRARESGADAPRIAELEALLQRVRSREVFGLDDVRDVTCRELGPGYAVHYRCTDARAQAFKDFSRRHLGRSLAILLDGRVEVAPMIVAELSGEGVIEGAGAYGFSKLEAQLLARVLGERRALSARLAVVELDWP